MIVNKVCKIVYAFQIKSPKSVNLILTGGHVVSLLCLYLKFASFEIGPIDEVDQGSMGDVVGQIGVTDARRWCDGGHQIFN